MAHSLTGVTTFLLLLITLVHGQTVSTPTKCTPVGIENGNFDSGELAPYYADSHGAQWVTPSAFPVNPIISIVSPGHNGADALQLEFPASNLTSWFFLQTIGQQCVGAQYTTSFAVNWLNFTSLHGDPSTNFCHLDIGPSLCFEEGVYNATDIPGWQYHTFTCTAQKNGTGSLVINVGCEATYDIPAFTLQFTDFDIHLVNSTLLQSTPTPPVR